MTSGEAEQQADQLAPGATVGSYEIVELIGSGGMGEVYRARHKTIGRLAAVKVLRADRAHDAKALDLFLKEATTLGALSHRNLVEVLDFGHLPTNQPYLTMAFVDGKTLHEVINESLDANGTGISAVLALTVTEQVLNALGEAHKKGIVHRDLKPANIMVLKEHSGETLVKVLDFGLARPVEGAVLPWAGLSSTKQSSAAGTPAYVSPEQVQNEELDGRSDLYSMGCTLFEMLSGRAPFVSESPLELVKMQLDAPPPPLADFVANLPEEVERLVLWFLQKKRDDRPESADVARLEVRRLLTKLSRESTIVRPASTLPSLQKLSGEHVAFKPRQTPAPVDTAPEVQAPARPKWPWVAAALGLVLTFALGVLGLRGEETVAVVVPSSAPAPVPTEPAPRPELAPPPAAIAEPEAARPVDELDELAPIDPRPGKGAPRPAPVAACRWSADFKALARRDHQSLQVAAAKRGVAAATLTRLEDEFGAAMVKRDCRGALRALDKLRRFAPSR
ncbi:MAG: serine/threonine-protein kinase [Myxococcales bacterium]|nr:serine/threonine-protein kinase [Myxococcales bacterium]